MAAAAELETREIAPVDERLLSELDNLSHNRLADGSYDPQILDDEFINLWTATQEAAMPFAVSTTEHKNELDPRTNKKTLMWLGRTGVEAAMSGYEFHRHTAALKRVDIEVDEAYHADTELKPGVAKVFLSPRMSAKDAELDIAEQEHLAHEDSVRVSWPEVGPDGQIDKRILQSLLVREVPLKSWVALLEDPNNLFGKSIQLADSDSALSVMAVHRELELPLEMLPEGPVTLVEAVLGYIDDPELQQSVAQQLELFRGDQADMRRKAENIAERWLAFEIALSQSLDDGFANLDIRSFIIGLQAHWSDDDLRVILNHQLPDTEYRMSRELAVVLEKAKRSTLWTQAAVVTNNPEVLKQLDRTTAQRIYMNEMQLQHAWATGQQTRGLESQTTQLVAEQNVRVGGGCPGEIQSNFKTSQDGEGDPDSTISSNTNSEDKENWKWKQGVCQVRSCPTRPGKTEVGPCSVCRNCQAKFDDGEDPTKISVRTEEQRLPKPKQPNLAEIKAAEAEAYEDEDLTRELDELVESEKVVTVGIY